MRHFGLIGYPLSHSFSGQYFAEKFAREGITDCYYGIYPIEHIHMLPGLIAGNEELIGLNVTIPYKELVIPFLNSVDDCVASIGAVNTIKIFRENREIKLKGFNTDIYGFQASIEPLLKKGSSRALILGTGGASKAAAYVLHNMGYEVTYVSRNPKDPSHLAYNQLTSEVIHRNRLIVNASPVGMYPHAERCPDIPYEYLTPDHVLFDLIYNPSETQFMAKGRCKGATAINGLKMLRLQAEKAWEIWNTGNY